MPRFEPNPTLNRCELQGFITVKPAFFANKNLGHANKEIGLINVETFIHHRRGTIVDKVAKRNVILIYWDELIEYAKKLKEGDCVRAIGQLERQVKNGDNYDCGCVIRPGQGMLVRIDDGGQGDVNTGGAC